ncbi:ATP-binding protein [Yoonia sp.]|uniref:ATP-binding protein n=1 Tax=Yoonia sp. TaxID=2212373 RepID=UPI001A0C0421|nr:ATP-binding protein [Yoonia sp.]MBE0413726.1 sensor histidine kinase N-terminal domain-containing protein [Yoonia sp.]
MTKPRSLTARLALSLGLLLMLVWLGAAMMTAVMLRHEMDEVFDAALQETAQRILPLAVIEILGRDDPATVQRIAPIRVHDELFTYVVRDAGGRVLLQSHAADPAVFPPFDGPGFRQTATHRLYDDAAVQGTISITIAEPLAHRAEVARGLQMVLGLPLLVVIPVALLAIFIAVRLSLDPLSRFRANLQARNARDLSAVPSMDLPAEIQPLADTLNRLLDSLRDAFEAERSFAANAAHELRTPLAGAIAQAQRIKSETTDSAAAKRADDIIETLKRLTRRTERLMQLARAEGGRLQADTPFDLRVAVQIVTQDMMRSADAPAIALHLPDTPVLSPLDPDALGILCRNLVENALRHGSAVDVTLTPDAVLIIGNDGPIVPPDRLAQLTQRFRRGDPWADGSGLGLYIVAAIADRTGSKLILSSPRPGGVDGFEAQVRLPT